MNELIRLPLLPGVRLTYLQTDKFKTDYISLNLLRPLRRDEAPLGALLPSVLLRGTEQYPDMEAICARLDSLYGTGIDAFARKKGEVQIIGFYMDFVDDALSPDGSEVLAPAVDFLGQALLHPVLEDGCLRADYVENEKINQINAIESQINDKRAWATKRLIETMFRDEAYSIGRLGEVGQVEAIDAPALTAYWKKILAHSNIEIFFMGRAPLAQVQRCLSEALQDLPRGEADAYGTQLVYRQNPVQEYSEVMDVIQGKLVMGLRTPDTGASEAYPALMMCNAIFGGSVTSKLFLNVRETRSLCYYANSGLEKFKGMMLVSAGIDCSQYETVRDAILAELEACRRGEISEFEMESARRYLISAFQAAEDAPSQLDDFYLGQKLLGVEGNPEDLIARIRAVTVEQVAAAAQRLALDTIYFVKGETDHA